MKNLFLPALSKAINTYLKLDPESEKRLLRLQNKVITIELLPFHFIFQLCITPNGIDIKANEELSAETKLCGTPLQMLGMMLHKNQRQQFFADDLKIEGNAELGQQIVELFDEIQIDWEEYLSRLVGDVPAYHTGRLIRGIGDWLQTLEKKFTTDVNEYLHEEIHWFPNREALNDFYNDIDTLRMDLDRMEAKILHLKQTLAEQEDEE